VVIQLSIT